MKSSAGGSNVFFPFFPNDHLNDLTLRGCHAAAKGIWIDMVCLMAQGKPFGYLRIEPGKPVGPPPASATPMALARGNATAHAIAPGTPLAHARGKAAARDTATAPAPGLLPQIDPHLLPTTGSLEAELHSLIGQPPDLTRWAIDHLESRGVFSRDDKGVIYSRRMVRWAKAREERSKRARESSPWSKKPGGAGGRGKPGGKAGGGGNATAHAIAPGTPHARADARAHGTPLARPSTTSTSITPPRPLPASGKGHVDQAAVAEQIRRRRA